MEVVQWNVNYLEKYYGKELVERVSHTHAHTDSHNAHNTNTHMHIHIYKMHIK